MRRKRLDFILIVLFFVYDRMTCEVNVGTHHLLQLFTSRDRPSDSFHRNLIHRNLSNPIVKTNHLNLTIHSRDVFIATGNSSEINKNKYNGATFTNNSQIANDRNKMISSNVLNKRRSRRDVFLLYNVVSCGTGCNPMGLMGYGCYCGFMGAGIPVDGIDKCCQIHDWCYENVPCPSFMLYFLRYNWQCVNGAPHCFAPTNNCAYQMCQCDRMFAECLKQQPCPTKKVFCRSAPLRLIQNLIFDVGIAG